MPTIPHIHIKIVHSRKRLRVAPRSCARRFLVNGSLRRAPHRKFSHHRGLSEDLPGRQGLYGRSVGATLVGSLYGALVAATPKDNSKRAWAKTERRWASGKRQIIEGVIDQLKDLFALERHRAKTLGGLLARLAAKMAAYTCGQRLNDQLGRPLRHLADLWSERLCITRLSAARLGGSGGLQPCMDPSDLPPTPTQGPPVT